LATADEFTELVDSLTEQQSLGCWLQIWLQLIAEHMLHICWSLSRPIPMHEILIAIW